MKDFLLAGCTFPAPFLKGRRMPSTAEDVLAETRRPLRALSRERRNRFDLESFIKQVYAMAFLMRYANEIVAREQLASFVFGMCRMVVLGAAAGNWRRERPSNPGFASQRKGL